MLLEGYIEFENRVPVALECLGKEYPIEIAGVAGVLATPLMFKGFYSKKKLGSLQTPKGGNVKFARHFNWGSVVSWPNGNSVIRACKVLFHDIDEQCYEDTGKKIALELRKWRSLLIENISLALQKDYRGEVRSKTFKSYGLGEFGLFRAKDGQVGYFEPDFAQNRVINVVVGKTLGFDVKGFQQILDETSRGNTPLLPFYFLFDAERAKFEENFRKSVLDSATSVEVCFSYLIGQILPFDEDLNKYVSSKHYSLRLKRELLKVLKVYIPLKEKEYTENLDRVRNKVIHGGYIPTGIEASTAYKIAKDTLYSLLPKKYEV